MCLYGILVREIAAVSWRSSFVSSVSARACRVIVAAAVLVLVVGCITPPPRSQELAAPELRESQLEELREDRGRTYFPAIETCPLLIAPIAEEYSNLFLERLLSGRSALLPRFNRNYTREVVKRCKETIVFEDDPRLLMYFSVALFANGETDRAAEFFDLVGDPYKYGSAPWLHFYGVMVIYGLGGSSEIGRGHELIQQAASTGYVPAVVSYADLHVADKFNVPFRPSFALDLYRQAARARYGTAAQRIGWMHEQGIFVTASEADARDWYRAQDQWVAESIEADPYDPTVLQAGSSSGRLARALPTSAYFHFILGKK